MSQTPTPGFIERLENCDLKDFKKEDIDMITREMNILYSKLRGLVIYDATSLEIFLTYLREGNLHLAELFRKRALFELLTIEEDRNYVMLMEEHDLEEGCEYVVQYSEYYFDPEEQEQGPTLLAEKKKQNPEKINVKERRSKPTKRLKDNTEVATEYFDPEFEKRRKKYRRKRMRPIIRTITPDVSISYQCSVIKEQRLSPEGAYSTKLNRNGDKSSELENQNIEVNETSDHKNSPLLSSTTDPKRDVQGEVNNLKSSSADERNGSAKPLKEITDNLESTRRRGMVVERISPENNAVNLNSVSNVIHEKNNNLVKDKTKGEQVLDGEHNNKTNTCNPLKQTTDILSEQNVNTLQESQRTPDHEEYIHMKDEENDDKIKQPRDFIDLTNLMGPVMSSRTNHSENDESSSPEQQEFDEVSARSPIRRNQEDDSSGRDLLMSFNMDNQKTTTNFKKERVDDEMSDDKNDNMVIQREMNPKSPKASRRPRTTKQDKEDIITEKDTYETNILKSAAELEDTIKKITATQRNIDDSSTSLQGNIYVEHLTKPSIKPVGNAQSSDNTVGLDSSTMNSEERSEVTIYNIHFMNTERSTNEVTSKGGTNNPDGVNISLGDLNADGQQKRTDSSMSIWQDNKSNANEPQAKYISSKSRFPKDARDVDCNDNISSNAMNNVESMITYSMQKGTEETGAKDIDATESACGSIVVSKDKNYDENVTRAVIDQKSDRSLSDSNRTDQIHISGIRSDVEKEKFVLNPNKNGHKTPITRRLSIGSVSTLSPIKEGEQIKDETDLKVSTESSSQPNLEETTKTNNQMEKGDDGTNEMKVSVNGDLVDGTLDGSKSQFVTNVIESEYEDSNTTSEETDGKGRIDDALTASQPWKQNIDSDNLTSASEGENDRVSSDLNRTKRVVDAETYIQHEGTLSDGSASNGLKAIHTGINTDSHELLTDNSVEMKESSLSHQLSEERSDSDSLGQEKRTILMNEETRPDVDKLHETQAENKNSSQHAVASKDTNVLQSNSLDLRSETSVTLIAKDDTDSVQNDNSKHSKEHVSEEGKVMQAKQSKVYVSSTTQFAFSESVSRERSVSPQNGELSHIGKDSTNTENLKRKEVDQELKQISRRNTGDSDPFQEGIDPRSPKFAENRSGTTRKTDDKINAKKVLKRVNEKMIKLDQQLEMGSVSVKIEQVSNDVRDATINNSIKKSSTSRVHRNGDRTLTPIQIHSNEQAGDERKSQNVYEPQELLRRSEEASLLLKQGNPNITDLSDDNRPNKLAERFSELYDNEYTYAFEELQKMNFDERKITYVLLCIVKHAYYFCSERASDERNRLMSLMKNAPAATSNGNRLKTDALRKGIVAQSLKDNAQSLSAGIWKEFFDSRYQSLFPEGIDSLNHRLLKYSQLCVEILWWMCVQDPPIYLSWIEETESREFDKDEYRSYTKSGNTVDFCVWPLVHLCKGGPILLKGIAQGK